jgi:hypothetical protein
MIASHIWESVYYRTSAGSMLRQYTTLDGKPTAGEQALATLLDNGVSYNLDYTQHRAYVISSSSLTPPSHPKAEKGRSSVEGMGCMLLPVYLLDAGI